MFLLLSLCGCKGVGSGPTWRAMHCAKASMNLRPFSARKDWLCGGQLECTPVALWAVLADIILLDCWGSGRTRTESKAPSQNFCGPVILLLLVVHFINRNPVHSEFFSSVFPIGCCCFRSPLLPFWLLGNRQFSSCAQNDMIRDPAEQGPGGNSEDISVWSCDGGTKKLLTKSLLENFSHIMAREKISIFFKVS